METSNNAKLPNYLLQYKKDSFLFTSESVGEGHPGEQWYCVHVEFPHEHNYI